MIMRSISKEEINTLPLYLFHGRIDVIDKPEEAREVLYRLSKEKVLGFDTETRPSFTKGESYLPSLLQLSTADYACLIRLHKVGPLPEIFDLLSNPLIEKVGVGIRDDLLGLQKIRTFQPEGFTDLAAMAKERGFENVGLRSLTAMVLGQRLSKAAKVTNWERGDLTEAQIQYAACDAQAGLRIYQQLRNKY